MANDNNNNNDNPLLNRKPNSLDNLGSQPASNPLERIGSRDFSSSYRRDIAIVDQRSRIQTVEMQRLAKQIEDLNRQFVQNMAEVARVRAGQQPATENLFRSLNLPADQARAAMASIPQANMIKAVVRQSADYEASTRQNLAQMSERYAGLEASRRVDAERLLQQHALSRASNPREGVRSLMEEPEVQAMAAEYARIGTTSSLTKGLRRTANQRETAGLNLAQTAGNISELGSEVYVGAGREFERIRRKEAAIELAITSKSQEYERNKERQEVGERIRNRILEGRSIESVKQGVTSGQYGSLKEESQKLGQREDEFLNALDHFTSKLQTTREVTEELNKNLKDTSKAYEDQRKIVKEISSSGGDGGRIGSVAAAMANWMPAVRGAIGVAQYAAVGADEQQMALRTVAANLISQKNMDVFSATQGDMAALRRITSRQYETAAAFGGAYRNRAEGAKGLDIGAQTALSGVQAGTAIIGGGSLAEAAKTAAGAAMGGVELAKGITGASTELGFAGLYGNLMNAVNQVPDAAKQAFFDYRMGAFGAMGNVAGSRTSALYAQATNKQTINQMAALGITPDQTAELFGLGARAIGSQFLRSPDTGRSIIGRAGEVQAAGVMSAQEYIQRVGQMTAAGGSQKDIEKILENAITRGVDNAKSLTGLMEAAQEMSRAAASRGIGMLPEVRASMLAGMESVNNLPIDEALKQNLIASRQQSALGAIQAAGSRISMGSLAFMGGVRAQLPGFSALGLSRAANQDPRILEATYRQYAGQLAEGRVVNPETIAALGEQAEIFVDPATGKARGRKALDIVKTQLLKEGLADYVAAGMMSTGDVNKLDKAISTGDISQLSKETQVHFGYRIKGLSELNQRTDQETGGLAKLPTLGGEAKSALDIKATSSAGQAKQIAQGGAPFGDSLAPIAQRMKDAVSQYDVTKATEEAAGAAKAMTLDASQFNQGVADFKTAVDTLAKAIAPLRVSNATNYGNNVYNSVANYLRNVWPHGSSHH
jgi:hypothetical protein